MTSDSSGMGLHPAIFAPQYARPATIRHFLRTAQTQSRGTLSPGFLREQDDERESRLEPVQGLYGDGRGAADAVAARTPARPRERAQRDARSGDRHGGARMGRTPDR